MNKRTHKKPELPPVLAHNKRLCNPLPGSAVAWFNEAVKGFPGVQAPRNPPRIRVCIINHPFLGVV